MMGFLLFLLFLSSKYKDFEMGTASATAIDNFTAPFPFLAPKLSPAIIEINNLIHNPKKKKKAKRAKSQLSIKENNNLEKAHGLQRDDWVETVERVLKRETVLFE